MFDFLSFASKVVGSIVYSMIKPTLEIRRRRNRRGALTFAHDAALRPFIGKALTLVAIVAWITVQLGSVLGPLPPEARAVIDPLYWELFGLVCMIGIICRTFDGPAS
ncbi:hypothetical protein [Parvularcula dongshanensis]|uniref:Uncharacterized protein n=1 Tax=Parvularcula dongshanensis TaxID=1173995 RepID=A0A840I1I0_9PROT|nr:hypothetical protein [Parvularcula dongshanensis]MBB4658205.1 hypothetical protein [Parvularcula dongshanensis]